jgi:hypothetical protein
MMDPKHFDTLRARAALAGYELLSVPTGPEERVYALAGPHAVHEATDLQKVEQFLDRQESRRMVLERSDA